MGKKGLHKNAGFTVPEGYFEGLENRLSAIPLREQTRVVPLRTKLVPYISLAAGFALLLTVGNFVLRKTPVQDYSLSDIDNEQIIYASSVSRGISLEDLMDYEEESADEEDIINYLIESGTPLNQIASLE